MAEISRGGWRDHMAWTHDIIWDGRLPTKKCALCWSHERWRKRKTKEMNLKMTYLAWHIHQERQGQQVPAKDQRLRKNLKIANVSNFRSDPVQLYQIAQFLQYPSHLQEKNSKISKSVSKKFKLKKMFRQSMTYWLRYESPCVKWSKKLSGWLIRTLRTLNDK